MILKKNTAMFAETNQFRFTCPIFGNEAQLAVCIKLRDLHMKGEPHPKRLGCSACMTANKCPVSHMMADTQREGRDDAYYSAEPKLGRLSSWVGERIAPIVVMAKTMEEKGVPPGERAAIQRATIGHNEPNTRGMAYDDEPSARKATVKPRPPKKTEAERTVQAAQRGDLGEAVTRAVRAAPSGPRKSLLDLAKEKAQ